MSLGFKVGNLKIYKYSCLRAGYKIENVKINKSSSILYQSFKSGIF